MINSQEILNTFITIMNTNIGNKLTPELATGMLMSVERVLNQQQTKTVVEEVKTEE